MKLSVFLCVIVVSSLNECIVSYSGHLLDLIQNGSNQCNVIYMFGNILNTSWTQPAIMSWRYSTKGSNPDLLTEVTYGELGFAPMMEKSGTGRMSPVRGRTMKEYDQQITELQKANFNLKLRIYFLEERMNIKSGEEDVVKYNIELKVEVEKYKQELKEKQDLLDKAAETINNLTATFSDELEGQVMKIKDEYEDKLETANKRVADLEDQVKMLDDCMKQTEEKYAEEHKELAEMSADLGEKDRLLEDLKERVKRYEGEVKNLTLMSAEREKTLEDKISQLASNVDRRDQDLQKLSLMVQESTAPAADVFSVSLVEKNQLQDELDGKKRQLERLEKEVKSKLQIIEAQKASEKQVLLKSTKYKETIQTLVSQLTNMQRENAELKARVEEQEGVITDLRQQLADVIKERDNLLAELQSLKKVRQKEEGRIADYENELEKLTRSLGKKQGELDQFQELLQTAQASLEMSEAAVLSLEKQLERERCCCKEKKSESDEIIKMREELACLHKQLEDQDQSYRAKCQELDAVARQLNITVSNQTQPVAAANGGVKGDNSDLLQKILDELNMLKGAVHADRHVHIDINSHSTMENPSQAGMDRETLQKMMRLYGLLDEKPPAPPTFSSSTSSSTHHSFHYPPSHSKIPVRRFTNQKADMELGDLRRQLVDLTARNRDLQKMLDATEETVHCQTRKMNAYKNLLVQHGIMGRSRSSSESNLTRIGLRQSHDRDSGTGSLRERNHSMDNLHKRGRSLSPTPVDRTSLLADRGEDLMKLAKENTALKQQVEGYKRLLKVFKDRSPSPELDLGDVVHDGGSEHATGVLEGYLDLLDKFLPEMSEGDQDGQEPSSGHNSDLNSLRRSLAQAKSAFHTLSELANKQGEGRVSPDSGCSDNSAHMQGASLKSQLTSPPHNTSPMSSPRGQRSQRSGGDREAGDQPDSTTHVHITANREPETSSYPDGDVGIGSQLTSSNLTTVSHQNKELTTNNRLIGIHPEGDKRLACSSTGKPISSGAGSRFDREEDIMDYTMDLYVSAHHNDNEDFLELPDDTSLLKPQNEFDFARPMEKTPFKAVNMPLERLKGRHFKTPKAMSSPRGDKSVIGTGNGNVFDETLAQSFFQHNADESCLAQSLDESRRNTANLKARIASLEDMIASYEKQIRAQSIPDSDLLHQHLRELRQLRLELERSNKHNEMLEQELLDFRAYSEATIQDLQHNLKELTNQLIQCQHLADSKLSSATDQLNAANDRSNTLQHKYENSRTEIHQYKLKLDKANNELNKTHAELEKATAELNIAHSELEKVHNDLKKANAEIEDCKKCCVESVDSVKITLEQYKIKLNDANVAYQRVQQDCEEKVERANQKVEQCLKECKEKLNSANSGMERCKRLCEQKVAQCRSACEEQVSECRQTCRKKEEQCGQVVEEYKQLLEQQRHKTADYKRQIDRQNQLVKDMKDRAENLRQEMGEASKYRETHEKQIAELTRELQECTKLRNRYKNNLMVVHTEMKRTKVLLREKEKELEVSGLLNSSRLLDISQKLESGADRLTDDDKQSIIAQLLEELMHVREQMKKLLDQNNSIRQKMTELLAELKDQRRRGNDPASRMEAKSETENFNNLDNSSNCSSSSSSFTDSPRLDTQPLRDITLGARISLNADSRSSSPLQSSDKARDCGKTTGNLSVSMQEGLSLAQYITRTSRSENNEDLRSSKESLDTDSSRSDGHPGSGPHFSVPGPIYKQGITDTCLKYYTTDSPDMLAAMTQVKIDSDLRSLFAVGMIDNFEKMKKETNEARCQLANLSTRVTERLKILSRMSAIEMIKSPEYSTLKEISYTADNLRICVESQHSLLESFWTSELPAPNEKGEFVNQKLLDENSALKERLATVAEKYERLMTASGQDNDEQICKYLSHTLDTMTRAKHNLQHTRRHPSWAPAGSPGSSPRKQDFSF